jgi:hypothetical protein
MSAMWLLRRRRLGQPAADPSRGRLVIALNGQAGIIVAPSLALALAPVVGRVMRPVPEPPWARSGDALRAHPLPATATARSGRRPVSEHGGSRGGAKAHCPDGRRGAIGVTAPTRTVLPGDRWSALLTGTSHNRARSRPARTRSGIVS